MTRLVWKTMSGALLAVVLLGLQAPDARAQTVLDGYWGGINAGAGRGVHPIKFNGTIFTVDGGGFDADYFGYFEDVDMGWRLWVLGHKVIFAPAAVAYHKGSSTTRKSSCSSAE